MTDDILQKTKEVEGGLLEAQDFENKLKELEQKNHERPWSAIISMRCMADDSVHPAWSSTVHTSEQYCARLTTLFNTFS